MTLTAPEAAFLQRVRGAEAPLENACRWDLLLAVLTFLACLRKDFLFLGNPERRQARRVLP